MKKLFTVNILAFLSVFVFSFTTKVYAAYPRDCDSHKMGETKKGFLEYSGRVTKEKVLVKPEYKWIFIAANGEKFEIKEDFGMIEGRSFDLEDVRGTLLSLTPEDFIVYAHVKRGENSVSCLSKAIPKPW